MSSTARGATAAPPPIMVPIGDLEFVTDGYEATCHHYELYKVFAPRPHQTPYAGHLCENQARKAGARTVDAATLVYRLSTYPSIATSWELQGGGITGTVPGARR